MHIWNLLGIQYSEIGSRERDLWFVKTFLSMFSNIGFAKKTCMENGTWYISPLTNKTWTDFTGCSFEEQWRQSLNVSNYLKSLPSSFKI